MFPVALITSGYTPTTERTPSSSDCRPVKLVRDASKFGKIWSAFIFPYDFRDTNTHARVRVLAAEANIAVSVQIMQYAAGLVFFIVLLRHAFYQVVHKFSKKSTKHLTSLGSRQVT